MVRRLLILTLAGLLTVSGCRTAPPSVRLHDRYALTDTGELDSYAEPMDKDAIQRAFASGRGAGDTFAGTDRGDAKTSIAAGDTQIFSTVTSLRSSLPSDDDMLSKSITKDRSSQRVDEENHNVTVTGFIYAIHKESDNDFHLIVGDASCHKGPCLMNAEVSGLPPSSSPDHDTLHTARQQFLAFFDGDEPGTGRGYQKSDPPIPVTIAGSLFFDVDHRAGVVGPTGFRPNSAWEIHPVTTITFEPQ